MGIALHSFPVHHHVPSRKSQLQSRCSVTPALPWHTNRTGIHSPSSPNCQPHSVEHLQGHPWRHSHRTCSTGMTRRENLCSHVPSLNPSGLSSRSTGLWTPRQPTDPLTPPSSVLVAQYGLGCHQVRPKLFSLCHVKNSSSSPHRQARPIARTP